MPPIAVIVVVYVTIFLGFLLFVYRIQEQSGVWIVPRWLLVLLISVIFSSYLFAALFHLLNNMFFNPGKKRGESIYEWGAVVHWGYMCSVPVHFLLLFGVGLSLFEAFGAAVGGCVVAPVCAYRIFRPIQVRRAATERIRPHEVAAIAQQNESFVDFLETVPDVRVFVTDTEHRYRFARVCALHRFRRPEDPSVIQETVFEVQVDMCRRRALEGSEVFQTYLYRAEEAGYAVLVLPIPRDGWEPGQPANIDRATLDQLATVPARFPDLDRYPLPIASRNREAVEVRLEKVSEAARSPAGSCVRDPSSVRV